MPSDLAISGCVLMRDVECPGRVFKSGQKRGVHGQIKKELRRRPAIEPAIGETS